MAKLNLNETKDIVNKVLTAPVPRDYLHKTLQGLKLSEPLFYAAVLEYQNGLGLDAEKTFQLLQKLTTKVFRDDRGLMNKLSPEMQKQLPQPTLGALESVLADLADRTGISVEMVVSALSD